MKKFLVIYICLCFIIAVKSFAQITITSSDVQNYIKVGNKLAFTDDTTHTSLNIGSKGATSWDFSTLSSDSQYSVTIVDPSTTTFGNNYPSSTYGFSGSKVVEGYLIQGCQYFGVNNALLDYGYSGQGNVSGFQVSYISKNIPASKNLVLPITMGTSWTEDYERRDSTIIPPLPTNVSVTKIHDENTVDAYGNMTLPGGVVVPALRIKTDAKMYDQTGGYTHDISYWYLSTGGTQVTVSAADTTSPDTGIIHVSDISFIILGVTGVKQENNTIPKNFNLEQNYPNPFNPTTTINYSVSMAGLVTLKVYDELGREVETLVNEQKAPGNYIIDFNAAGLSSGVYFYQLKAEEYISTKKMILLK